MYRRENCLTLSIEAESTLKKRVLLIDDELELIKSVESYLREQNFETTVASSIAEAQNLMCTFTPDVVIADISFSDGSVLDWIETNYPDDVALFILVTESVAADDFLRAKALGIETYLLKPVRLIELSLAVKFVLVNYSKRVFSESYFGLVGSSFVMKNMYLRISKMAVSDCNVLVTGETGVGKELVAKALHNAGVRSKHPFIAVNCGSIPDSLLQSELFGHVKGAYTGAIQDKMGLFKAAGEGTLFLDEIEAASPLVQSALLRVLEQKEYIPIGSTVPHVCRARIVLSSNADLLSMCNEGKFRKDLYYRLTSAIIQVPTLRSRREDIPLLVDKFVADLNENSEFWKIRFSLNAKTLLCRYEWPGNVRQLKNIIERCAFESPNGNVKSGLVCRVMAEEQSECECQETLKDLEKKRVQEVLSVSRNKSEAARVLGISRGTLYSLIEKHSLT